MIDLVKCDGCGTVLLRTDTGWKPLESSELDYECEHEPEALECIEADNTCRGEVDYRSVPHGTAVLRCASHFARRLDRYENSIERYAHSDVPPDWFDPANAGEHWSEEDY